MTTLERIEELSAIVIGANTSTFEGRQYVVKSCRELYNAIEEDVYKAGLAWMLKGMYAELCGGNFAEPFMCEKKKSSFSTVVQVYKDFVLPKL